MIFNTVLWGLQGRHFPAFRYEHAESLSFIEKERLDVEPECFDLRFKIVSPSMFSRGRQGQTKPIKTLTGNYPLPMTLPVKSAGYSSHRLAGILFGDWQ